ncbi:MAG: WYL domain-containing protein [Phycisphaerae bacterium]|nr:WYL domain-containing protein [Phycisphaerae bacterium]
MDVLRVRRIIKIMQLLQSGREVDADGLTQEFGVGRRTIFRDLNLLELAGVPCRFSRKDGSYRLHHSISLPPIVLSLEEALALMLLTRKVLNEQMLPDYESAAAAAVKVESCLPPAVREYCGEVLNGVDIRWWPMSETAHLRDLLPLLQRCCVEHQRVRISYDSFYDGKNIEVTLRPYRLAFIRRGWYVIGQAEEFNEVRTFKLERISRIRENYGEFNPDPNFSLKDYFGNAWQMIREGRRYHVRIRFLPKVAGNVEEIVWHKTQMTERLEDDSLLFQVDVDGIQEISWWVLGYGDQAIVLDPPELRELVIAHARGMLQHYTNHSTGNEE